MIDWVRNRPQLDRRQSPNFLPISSTGHLLIAEQWLGQCSDTFNIVIPAGAIVAVTIVYWPA